MKNNGESAFLLLSSVILMDGIATYLVASALIVTDETRLVCFIWVAGFSFLFFNVAYLFHLAIAYVFTKKPVLKEVYVKSFPTVALVYPIRNEEFGLYERMDYSFSGNVLPNLDFWILSDSDEEYESVEMELVRRLSEKYGARVHYRRRQQPVERKQGNIKEFLQSHPEYHYLYIADADGMVPRWTILKLLRKAEHPENQDIAIFQCLVRIAHARTWYARFERIGVFFAQKLNFTVIQALFRRSISFGHHHLARASLLSGINLPKGLLSHDNWDTVILDQMGYRVAFCPDVHAFDESPSSYLEARARAKRWAQGTLQGWPLVFMPKVSFPSRFLAFYGIYLYLADLVFLGWVILGLLSHSSMTGEWIHFKIDSIFMGCFTNRLLQGILFFTFGVIFFHKFVLVRNLSDLRELLYEILLSTLITLNNFLYVPMDILSIPLRKLGWKPMRKDPFAKVTFFQCAKELWPGTALGVVVAYFMFHSLPYVIWPLAPILVSLIFSIPFVYFTARAIPATVAAWI